MSPEKETDKPRRNEPIAHVEIAFLVNPFSRSKNEEEIME